MPKPKPEEIAKLKERISTLSADEKEAVLEALEPDILQKVKALLLNAKPPDPDPDPAPKPEPKKPWWDIF